MGFKALGLELLGSPRTIPELHRAYEPTEFNFDSVAVISIDTLLIALLITIHEPASSPTEVKGGFFIKLYWRIYSLQPLQTPFQTTTKSITSTAYTMKPHKPIPLAAPRTGHARLSPPRTVYRLRLEGCRAQMNAAVVKIPAGAVNSRCCIKSGHIGMHGNVWQAWVKRHILHICF